MAKKFRDIEDVAAEPIAVEIDGKELFLSPLRLRDHSQARRHMRAQSLLAYVEAMASMPEDMCPTPYETQNERARLLRVRIADEELFEFYDTLEGLQYLIWQSLYHKHPDMTLDAVEEMLTNREQLEALCTTIAEISGLRGEGEEASTENPTSKPSQNGKAISPPSADSTAGQ